MIQYSGAGRGTWEIISHSGATVTGGIIFGALAVFIYSRLEPTGIITRQTLDVLAISVPLGHMFGRIGCFFGGCCYGQICESGSAFCVTYPENWLILELFSPDIVRGPRIPTPLIAAAGLLLIFLLLLLVFKKTKTRGQVLALYFMIYGAFRFFNEFLRGDTNRGIWGDVSTGQIFGILSFTFGCFLLILYLRDLRLGRAGPPFKPINGREVSDKDLFDK